jgi:predicted CXXCH cytochrome family protein
MAAVENVACAQCHDPAPESHPDQIMPTNVSSRMCGDCHVETFAQFETSVHEESELACVNCHDAHGTDIKTDKSTELCASCHRDNVHFFSYTPHAEEGLVCVDCHLMVDESAPVGEGHGTRIHTFTVSLDVCKDCHEDEMHYPTASTYNTSHPDEQVQAGILPGSQDEYESNPFQFILLATIVGMGAGLILSPWIERWYERVSSVTDRS